MGEITQETEMQTRMELGKLTKRNRFHYIIKSHAKIFITLAASSYVQLFLLCMPINAQAGRSSSKNMEYVEIAETTEVENSMKMMGNQLIKTCAIIPAATL